VQYQQRDSGDLHGAVGGEVRHRFLLSVVIILVCLAGCRPASPAPEATEPARVETPTLAPATVTAPRRTDTPVPTPPATVTPTPLADVTCANVLFVRASEAASGSWSFDVTVQHKDTGWEHYADAWDVLSPAGEVLATRVLAHPHVDEQPFTRSLSGVELPADVMVVHLRAHDLVHGYCGKEVIVNLTQSEGPDFEVVRSEASAMQLRAMRVDQPPQIDGELEPAWESAPPLNMSMTWGTGGDESAYSVEMRALYDSDSLYLLARWPDAKPRRQDADINKLTVHWRIEAGAIHCAVACHTAYVAGDLTVRALNSETIPQGTGEMLPVAGGWEDGEWIVEWSRPLTMANAYDLQFANLQVPYPFLVKVFEFIPDQPDPVSPMAELLFQ